MIEERRSTKDRRTKATRPLCKYTFVGRRKTARRKDEADNYYVDKYEGKYLFLFGLIIVFAIFDTIFSLKIFEFGGEEINPFMSILIKKSLTLALIIKYVITVMSILIILIHKNFRIFKFIKIRFVIHRIFNIYFVVLIYECYCCIVLISR